MIIKILLWIHISLFILHEMDAVYAREWRMIKPFRSVDDALGSRIFIALHFILYFILLYLVNTYSSELLIFMSAFFIFHFFLHIIFRGNSENRMNNAFSETLIFILFLNSVFSFGYYFILR